MKKETLTTDIIKKEIKEAAKKKRKQYDNFLYQYRSGDNRSESKT